MLAVMKPELLNEADVQQALMALPGWHVEGRELTKEFPFASYLAGIAFVNQVARLAEEMNHHPDLLVSWRKVTVHLTTHSAGGLTKLDLDLARRLEPVAQPCVQP